MRACAILLFTSSIYYPYLLCHVSSGKFPCPFSKTHTKGPFPSGAFVHTIPQCITFLELSFLGVVEKLFG